MKKLYFLIFFFFIVGLVTAQEQLSKEEIARREKNIEAANPFKQFGYKAKIATLSKGKYLEVHDLDSIVTIGSIRFHVDRKEIVGNAPLDTINGIYARPIGDVPSRWLSPDPLSEEFPDWTPYRFGFNNPIRYNDPTGMLENDGDYFDKNGQYLGSDNIDDKKIYITSNSNPLFLKSDYSIFNTPKGFYNKNGSVNEAVAQKYSKDITDSSINRSDVAGGILNHYYQEAGYNLKELKSGKIDDTSSSDQALASARLGGVTGRSGYLAEGEKAILVDYSALGRTVNNGYDILNLFSHERGKHIPDLLEGKISLGAWILENRATLHQLKSPTWEKTSPEFQKHIKVYQGYYLYPNEYQKYFNQK
ncbi:hypothetical protein [Flavobacterium sp. '19STA2R22 D10 B1']|uniref:hypothetical protein n=1 Tax=Flavobacterium aerium TaxID=3037261 RepID=UPI00278BE296|nr:hypothetical protein [Flavobacterium sp. '19STA2R22 D10 B1']